MILSSFNEQFLYSIIIIIIGYILKRLQLIKERDGEGLARIIFNLTLPALIIVSFNNFRIDPSLILLPIIGAIFGVLIAGIAFFVFRYERKNIKGMLMMMVPGFNVGLFAFPLVEAIWGKDGFIHFAMFDVGNAFIVFGLIYIIGSIYAGREDEAISVKHILGKIFKSVPFMTYIIVFIMNLIDFHLPSLVIGVAEKISVANMPLSLLLLGIYLNLTFDRTYSKALAKVLFIRYGVGLAIGITLFLTLPFNDMFKYTMLIGLVLPASATTLPYSVEFGYDQRFIGITSNITILLSFILLWGLGNIIL